MTLSDITKARDEISRTAQAMLNDEICYITGSRRICDLLIAADLQRHRFESPLVAFVAIDSDTDHIPIGEVRAQWSEAAQHKFAAEWAKAEHYAKTIGQPACEDVIAWLMEGAEP